MVTSVTSPEHSYSTTETLSDGEEWVVNLEDGQTGPVIVRQIAHGGSCDVELVESAESDAFVRGKSVSVDSLSGSGVSMGNELQVNDQQNMYLVVTNTSGGEADYMAAGVQVRP